MIILHDIEYHVILLLTCLTLSGYVAMKAQEIVVVSLVVIFAFMYFVVLFVQSIYIYIYIICMVTNPPPQDLHPPCLHYSSACFDALLNKFRTPKTLQIPIKSYFSSISGTILRNTSCMQNVYKSATELITV